MNETDKTIILFFLIGIFICFPSICICYKNYSYIQKNKNNNYIEI